MSNRSHFIPAQVKKLNKVIDSFAADQLLSTRDRERLGEVIIRLAQSDFSSDAELRRRLLRESRDLMLESGSFLEPRLRSVSLQELLAFRQRKQDKKKLVASPA